MTLDQALNEAIATRWKGLRCLENSRCQAQIGIATLHDIAGEDITVAEVTTAHLRIATSEWARSGNKAATINRRLMCLSAMGVKVSGCTVKQPNPLKWWLSGPDEEMLLIYLRTEATFKHAALLADFIQFTTRTGLRIEETLRLTWNEVQLILTERPDGTVENMSSLTVPGTKTKAAQASLPLSAVAATHLAKVRAERIAGTNGIPRGPVFPIAYWDLQLAWKEARKYLGHTEPRFATLKALRRSAARHLTVGKGMPLDMLRQYLRHGNVKTTQGYLHLTGGYATEEMRKWL